MTGHASMETATAAMRLGAADYMTKPCKLADIEAVLLRMADRRELKHKNLALETRVQKAEGPSILVGDSQPMHDVQRFLAMVAPTDATVLILGETGSGKELAARTLWQQSKRADMPFIPVNCGALAEHLVESELFGHRKGAFTGADRDHKGMFEVANGGTVFLDEVGELNKNMQVKLLRFLEAKEVRRVGDTEPFRSDVRVLCATNRDLRQMIQDDLFREDLYFRINTFEIRLPPLRERKSDIADLARHLLARARPPAFRSGGRHADARGDQGASGSRLVGQRPRAGQRDGARLHPFRRRNDHSGASAPPGASPLLRPIGRACRPRRRCAENVRRDRNGALASRAGKAQGQQDGRGRGTRDQPQDDVQQAQPAGEGPQVGRVIDAGEPSPVRGRVSERLAGEPSPVRGRVSERVITRPLTGLGSPRG